MTLSLGVRLGPYEILSPLGAGGMGEVYRARDTKLGRDVALKILPETLATDPDRLARFQREAHVLASLNHPNIAHIHGLEESHGVRALVMELVEGDDLSERIARGPIPIDEALPIAKQIADALEAAHEQAIIHRDLKPANIKVRSDGTVKVLDFGLAKLVEPTGVGGTSRAGGDLTQSPTITSPAHMTGLGVILGTAAYMSPEQAKGRAADKRADIWAFGVVLFEMLTARRAFEGETISDVLAKVIEREPDWSALSAATSPRLRELLRRCLKKDPKTRLRDIGDARVQIEELLSGAPEEISMTGHAVAVARSAWWHAAVIGVVAAVVSAGAGAALIWRYKPASPGAVARLSIPLAEGQRFQIGAGRQILAMSPDGTALVYFANRRLYLRALADAVATPLTAASPLAVHSPAFSPDGRYVVFYSGTDAGGTLKKVATSGGAEFTVCATMAPFGVSWGESGIVFGERRGVMRVSADGGKPELLVAARDGEAIYGPHVLPDGRSVLFTVAATAGGTDRWDKGRIVVQSLASGERKTLIDGGGSDARYMPTGHLVYALRGNLFAVPFNAQRLLVTGTPAPVLVSVLRQSRVNGPGAAEFSVAETGSLAYVRESVSGGDSMDLMWQTRQGALEAFGLPPAAYSTPRLSPDGRRVAFDVEDGEGANVWISNLTDSNAPRRLTFGGANHFPTWWSDNERVAFQSDREGDLAIFWQRADGTDEAERLTKPDAGTAHVPYSWARDGVHLLYGVINGARTSLWVYDSRERKAAPFGRVESSFPPNAVFAPDGRSVAYVSGEALNHVFVQPFPATGATYPVAHPDSGSPTTEANPFWSADGTELFYARGPGDYVVVRVRWSPSFGVGNPSPVSAGGRYSSGPGNPREYDISHDGQRFLIVARAGAGPAPDQIQVVLNWTEELKRLTSR